MTMWPRLALFGLLVASMAGPFLRGSVAQENPMTPAPVVPVAPEVEPEPKPEPVPPVQPGVAAPVPNAESARRMPVVEAPLPPARPFFSSPIGAPPLASQPPSPAPPAAPSLAPAAPSLAPAAPSLAPAAPSLALPSTAPRALEPPSGADGSTDAAGVTDEPEIELTPNMRIASLPVVTQRSTTEEIEAEEAKTPEPTLVEKQTDAVDIACLQPDLLKLVQQAGDHFGATPVITSGQRSRGRRNSYHRRCMAADFFVPGVERAQLAKYLRSLPNAGGVGTYCHTKSVHIDIGEPRNWWQCGFRTRFALR